MFIRGLIGAIIGAVGGAAVGALTLGWDASMAIGSSWIGPTRDWWPLSAMFGALAGATFGLALGLYISLAVVGMRRAFILGCGVGSLGVFVLIVVEFGNPFWWLRSVPSRIGPLLLSTTSWALIGLLLSVIASKMSHLFTAPND